MTLLVVGKKADLLNPDPKHPVKFADLTNGKLTEVPLRDPFTMKPMAAGRSDVRGPPPAEEDAAEDHRGAEEGAGAEALAEHGRAERDREDGRHERDEEHLRDVHPLEQPVEEKERDRPSRRGRGTGPTAPRAASTGTRAGLPSSTNPATTSGTRPNVIWTAGEDHGVEGRATRLHEDVRERDGEGAGDDRDARREARPALRASRGPRR